ncbi:MAG: hypothetical protein JNK87_28865 [Bryobacterales bacterium]|nr:hypothetical protein [Bryobacterales bacterium]
MLLAALFTAAASAQTATWTAARTLRIEFRMPTAAWPLAPNTVNVYGGYVTLQQPHTGITASLYNNGVLMGTSFSPLGAGATGLYSYYGFGTSFKTATSPWAHGGTPTVVDFTPLRDRTIQGRIDVNIATGSMLINLGSVALAILEAAGPNYEQSIYPSPIITSVKRIPELPTDPPPPPSVVPGPPVIGGDDDIVMSPSVFKANCEATKGSAIGVRTNLAITGSSSAVQVASGCTIDLAANVNLIVESANLTFTGPLNIQSRSRGALKMNKSLLAAPTITVDFRGSGSEVSTMESTLRATGGTLAVALTDEAQFEVSKRYSGQTDSLWSTAKVTLSAGNKLNAGLFNANIRGNLGVEIQGNGAETTLKSVDDVVLNAPQGSIQLTTTGSKSLFEISDSQMLFGHSLALTLTGTEGTIKLSKATLGPASGTAAAGITIETSANRGLIEGSEVTLRRARSATLRASRTGSSGILKWEKGSGSISGNIVFEASGATEVKDGSFSSPTSIRIFTPGGGSCDGSSNSLSAPLVQVCPAF